jgi:hypothetical protein
MHIMRISIRTRNANTKLNCSGVNCGVPQKEPWYKSNLVCSNCSLYETSIKNTILKEENIVICTGPVLVLKGI